MERLVNFLALVRKGSFSNGRPPSVWSAEYREALSASLVRIGWGGRIELTDAGRNAVEKTEVQPRQPPK